MGFNALNREDLTGRKFGMLTVIGPGEPYVYKGQRQWRWNTQCECGSVRRNRTCHLMTGHVKSCGCVKRKENGGGHARRTHGLSDTPEYQAWHGARTRCMNPKERGYYAYGGRGIKMCDRWLNSFENFLADVGMRPSPEHSIDRIDNDGNYEPGNIRWATIFEQNNNMRRHSGRIYPLREIW